MNKLSRHIILPAGFIMAMLLPACGTHLPGYDFREIAHAAIRLDMDIDQADNHRLYIEAARWIDVPYRYGGNTMRGTDCSGLTANIYKKVYHKKLKRSVNEQCTKNCRKIARRNLKEGDLVFFHDGRRKRSATHVGIYLKEGKFIHASTSQGVIVSRLDEPYYDRRWMQGGRIKD